MHDTALLPHEYDEAERDRHFPVITVPDAVVNTEDWDEVWHKAWDLPVATVGEKDGHLRPQDSAATSTAHTVATSSLSSASRSLSARTTSSSATSGTQSTTSRTTPPTAQHGDASAITPATAGCTSRGSSTVYQEPRVRASTVKSGQRVAWADILDDGR